MGALVRTWADHLEPIDAANGFGQVIGRANVFVPSSYETMNKEYVNDTDRPVSWFTAEDGSLFFNPFGRALAIVDPASDGPDRPGFHTMYFIDESTFGFTYLDDKDFLELQGETLTTLGGSFVISDQARLGFGAPEAGQVLVGGPYYSPTACGKLAPVT